MHIATFIAGILLVSVCFSGGLVLCILTLIGSTGFGYGKRVLQSGDSAVVRIAEVRPTSSRVNNAPVVHFVLEVHPLSAEAYRLERNVAVPLIFLSRVQPGAILAAKYDPNDREKVAFDFRRDLTEHERAVLPSFAFLYDLVSADERRLRLRGRIGLSMFYLLAALACFGLGMYLVLTSA